MTQEHIPFAIRFGTGRAGVWEGMGSLQVMHLFCLPLAARLALLPHMQPGREVRWSYLGVRLLLPGRARAQSMVKHVLDRHEVRAAPVQGSEVDSEVKDPCLSSEECLPVWIDDQGSDSG